MKDKTIASMRSAKSKLDNDSFLIYLAMISGQSEEEIEEMIKQLPEGEQNGR